MSWSPTHIVFDRARSATMVNIGTSGSILLHHTGLAALRAMECTAFIAEITTASTPAPVAVPAPTTIRPGTGVLTPGTHCPRAAPYTFPFRTRAKRENVGGVATS